MSKLHSYDTQAQAAMEYAEDTKLKIEKSNYKIMVIPMSMISDNGKEEIKTAEEEITGFGMKQR